MDLHCLDIVHVCKVHESHAGLIGSYGQVLIIGAQVSAVDLAIRVVRLDHLARFKAPNDDLPVNGTSQEVI